MPACARCGLENPAGFRVCGMCGAPLASSTTRTPEQRKVVTVVFADVAGSTALAERLDPETLRRVLDRYFDEVRRALEQHGGTVEKYIGDAVMAVFGIPIAHEDDALRAVRAAFEAQAALAALDEDLRRAQGTGVRARIGIHTGEVVSGDSAAGQRFATGDALVVAKRLESAAPAGGVLVGATTYRLVRDAVLAEPVGSLTLKGRAEAVDAYRVTQLRAPMARAAGAPFVGRDRERALLRDSFAEAARDRSCHLVTVVGEAGVGKSRLVAEFLAELDEEALVARGRCLPYGEAITFWPLREAITALAGIGIDDSPERAEEKVVELVDDRAVGSAIARLIGVTTASGGADGVWAMRRLLELLGQRQPLVLVLDDLQWAEELLLDVLEHVAGWLRDAPVLLVALARPELLDRRARASQNDRTRTITLEPLADDDAGQLMDALLAGRELEADLLARTVSTAGGNPLFLEELLAMLLEDATGGRVGELAIPPTVQALLSARLDQLEPDERTVLEHAAIAGEIFSRDGVGALVPEGLELDATLLALVRRNLVRPEDGDRFRFRHILIRDAAYEGMPKDLRAELHERDADWLEERAGERADEYAEIVGHHLEVAARYRQELGMRDDRSIALAGRAAERLAVGADRAIASLQWKITVRLLTRASELLRPGDARLPAVLTDLAQALRVLGELERAKEVVETALPAAERAGDSIVAAEARIQLAKVRLDLGLVADTSELRRACEEAIVTFAAAGDDRHLGRATLFHAVAQGYACRLRESRETLERGLVAASRARDGAAALYLRGNIGWALVHGPWPTSEGVRYWNAFRDEAVATGRRFVEEWAIRALAFLHAMEGRFDQARYLAAESAAIVDELGRDFETAGGLDELASTIETLAGNAPAAERALRASFERLEAADERPILATVAALLADCVLAQGRLDEADALTRTAALGPLDDVYTQTIWRSIRAKVHARRGDHAAAESLAREAVDLADRTDCLWLVGHAREALGDVLALACRPREAEVALREALRVFDRKGIQPAAERVRAKLQLVTAPVTPAS